MATRQKILVLYLNFLIEEVPNILQFFGILSLLEIFLKKTLTSYILFIVTTFLIITYLTRKFILFIQSEKDKNFDSANENEKIFLVVYFAVTIILIIWFVPVLGVIVRSNFR